MRRRVAAPCGDERVAAPCGDERVAAPCGDDVEQRLQAFVDSRAATLVRQYEQNGGGPLAHFFVDVDFHGLMNDDAELAHLLLLYSSAVSRCDAAAWSRRQRVGELLERCVHGLLAAERHDASLQPGHFRLLLAWDNVPFCPPRHNGRPPAAPTTLRGRVVAIDRPGKRIWSRSFRCPTDAQLCLLAGAEHRLQRRDDDAAADADADDNDDNNNNNNHRCHECGARLVEDASLRGECPQQRLVVLAPPQRPGASPTLWQVLLCAAEQRLLSPARDLGVHVAVVGRLLVTDARPQRRAGLALHASSLRRLAHRPPVARPLVAELGGGDWSAVHKVLGNSNNNNDDDDDGLYFYERLLLHVLCLSALVGDAARHSRVDEFGAVSPKLSVLFFGSVFEALTQTLAQLRPLLVDGTDASTSIVTASSAGRTPVAPRVVGEQACWRRFEAGAAHHARDGLLLLPNVAALPPAEQRQLASIVERGAVSTKLLEVPSSDCQLALLAWCTVADDAALRSYRRGQLPLARLLGGRVEPALLQSCDVVAHVDDRRPPAAVVGRRLAGLLSDDGAAWIKSAAALPPASMGPAARALLQRYFEAHRAARSHFSRRDMYRVAVVAALCARMLHAATIAECHCLLAVLFFESSLMWKGSPPLLTDGLPARSRADLELFREKMLNKLA